MELIMASGLAGLARLLEKSWKFRVVGKNASPSSFLSARRIRTLGFGQKYF
jgi:hypothetical protein